MRWPKMYFLKVSTSKLFLELAGFSMPLDCPCGSLGAFEI